MNLIDIALDMGDSEFFYSLCKSASMSIDDIYIEEIKSTDNIPLMDTLLSQLLLNENSIKNIDEVVKTLMVKYMEITK